LALRYGREKQEREAWKKEEEKKKPDPPSQFSKSN